MSTFRYIALLAERVQRPKVPHPSCRKEFLMQNYRLEPSDKLCAWTVADLARENSWQYNLTDGDIVELQTALDSVKRRKLGVPDITSKDFPLRGFGEKLRDILDELEEGRGVFLIHGLPMERYSKQDAGTIFWGIGAHLGRSVAQNAYGDVLGHVRDIGKDWTTDMNARGYQTTLHLPFHNNSCDIVGLLCLRTAKSGGLSSVVSSVSIHDKMMRQRPDLAKLLYEPFHVDRRGEEAAGDAPYYLTPIFNNHNGRLFIRYNRVYIESAQRFSEVPRLTPAQFEALDMFDALCRDESLRCDMELQPGDIQFVNNYVSLHSRTQYEDHQESDRKRHLLRLWLFTRGLSDIPEALKMRYRDMDVWQANPRAPIYDVDAIMNVANH